jgi:hypothetical protein
MAVLWPGQLDPLETVEGVTGTRYHVPDLLTLEDRLHRLALQRHLVDDRRYPRARADMSTDIDRLLDRRAWLAWPVTLEDTCPSRRSPTT